MEKKITLFPVACWISACASRAVAWFLQTRWTVPVQIYDDDIVVYKIK